MYTAYRLNDPREIMPPHRHSPNAIRFGLTGKQNFTGVEGENITFGPGDMVLTPHDTWHNHGNQGDDSRDQSQRAGPAARARRSTPPISSTTTRKRKKGERVRKAVQSERFPSDYSQRVYGQAA